MEREELMENMYEKKIEILERNVLETQIYTRKKRKREKEEEEVCLYIFIYIYIYIYILVHGQIKEATQLNPNVLGFNWIIHLLPVVTRCKVKCTNFQLENSDNISDAYIV